MTFRSAGSGKLTIKQTDRGRRLLKHSNRLKLTAQGRVIPTAQAAVTAQKKFTLAR